MTITDSELLAIEARAKAATTGPWEHASDDKPLSYPAKAAFVSGEFDDVHSDVLRLVAEVRRLRAKLEGRG